MRATIRIACAAALLSSAAVGPAQAQEQAVTPQVAERTRIEHERTAAQARFVESQRGCRERFVVTSCVETAERERRETLARLRREQYALDESMRSARAERRTELLRSKAKAQAERASESADRVGIEADRSAAAARKPASQVTAETRSAGSRRAAQRLPSAADVGLAKHTKRSAPDALRSRAAYDEAQRAAAAHRAEVEERAARRMKNRRPAAPLPLPAGVAPP